jgi:hypothetical protein
MSEKFKKIPTITKIFYLLALLLFLAWVVPSIMSYYNHLKSYQKSSKEIQSLASQHDLSIQGEKFSEASFRKYLQSLFSKATLKPLTQKNKYELTIKLKPEELKKFYNFLETLSLRFRVKLKENLSFDIKDKIITAKMQLTAF